jgi:hypothetical protein
LVLGILAAVPVRAQPVIVGGSFLTGAQLLAMCESANPTCTGYVTGVADALAPLSQPGGPLPVTSLASFCAQKLTVKQVITEFQKFMKNNPEGRETNAAQLVGDALHLAYPCSRR